MEKLANGRALAALAWVSVFTLAWLMVTSAVTMWPAGIFFVFFLVVAVGTSAIVWNDGQEGRKRK